MSAITHLPRQRTNMLSRGRRLDPPKLADNRLLEENGRLIQRISQLRAALEAAGRDNAELRGRLARLQCENDQLRYPTPSCVDERRAQWRDSLIAPWSRNP